MSDLAATNCGGGCGCDNGCNSCGNGCNSSIWIILLLLIFCGGCGDGANTSSLFGGGCGCDNGCDNGCGSILPIIIILALCGNCF